MPELTTFVVTVGEPVVLETLARLKKFTPVEHTLTVWYDLRGQPVNSQVLEGIRSFTDDIILTTKLHGQCEAYGFAFLYLHSPWLLLTYADILVKPDFYQKLRQPFDVTDKLASVGQATCRMYGEYEFDSRDNHPDHIYLIRREAIDSVGGCCPSFRTYGHVPLEWHYRALAQGWHYGVHQDIVHWEKDEHTGRDSLQNSNQIIVRNTRAMEESLRQGFHYPWWTNNLLED